MPGNYDKIIRENFDELLPHLLRLVAHLDIPKMVDLKDKLQTTIEREMDNLKRVVHDNPALDYGIHWEVQSTDEDMRSRNFIYYGLFYEKYQIPLRQFVVYIGDQPAKKILNNVLELEGVRFNFSVIDIKKIPKDLFLQSGTPEAIILAVLADFGADKPQQVIRQILDNLSKLIPRIPRLQKYQRQLLVLSRLRKLTGITQQAINTMPIHYEIETDELYLEGIEKGIEQGIEQGIEKGIEEGLLVARTEAVTRMLQQEKYTLAEIMLILGVTEAFVLDIAARLDVTVIRASE